MDMKSMRSTLSAVLILNHKPQLSIKSPVPFIMHIKFEGKSKSCYLRHVK